VQPTRASLCCTVGKKDELPAIWWSAVCSSLPAQSWHLQGVKNIWEGRRQWAVLCSFSSHFLSAYVTTGEFVPCFCRTHAIPAQTQVVNACPGWPSSGEEDSLSLTSPNGCSLRLALQCLELEEDSNPPPHGTCLAVPRGLC
jgi:hypothetical protein